MKQSCLLAEGLEEMAGLELKDLNAVGVIRARKAPGGAAG